MVDPCKRTRKSQPNRLITICTKKPQLLEQIRQGIILGTNQCQHQFRNRRWNCTSERKTFRRVILRGLHSYFLFTICINFQNKIIDLNTVLKLNREEMNESRVNIYLFLSFNVDLLYSKIPFQLSFVIK